MKFTEGYWCLKKGIIPLYAVEYANHRICGNELKIYAPGKHIANRGDCLNLGLITVCLTSPMENVIKVSIRHFEGTAYPGPFTGVKETSPYVEITEDENIICYQSGHTKAVIDKRPNSWGIRFFDGERLLTDTGYRNIAYMSDENTGKNYITEQLALDVDEYIYGLGEQFTPFVKTAKWWRCGMKTAEQPAILHIKIFPSTSVIKDMEFSLIMREMPPMKLPVKRWSEFKCRYRVKGWITI